MVLVIDPVAGLAIGHVLRQVEQVRAGGQDLSRSQGPLIGTRTLELDAEDVLDPVDLRAKLAVQLVTADASEVIALRVEERVLKVLPSRLGRQRLSRTCPLVDLEEGVLTSLEGTCLLLPLVTQEVEVVDEVRVERLILVTKGTQEGEQREAALPGDAGPCGNRLVGLVLDVELDPLTAIGVDGPSEQRLGIAAGGEDRSGRANQL